MRYVQNRTYEDYAIDDYFRSAVERQFEVWSEALKIAVAADISLAESIPRAPKIIGMRNRIAHSYDVLDDEIIWLAAVRHVPEIVPRLESLLE